MTISTGRVQSGFALLVATIMLFAGCKNAAGPDIPAKVSGSVITGQVIDRSTSQPVAFARVGLFAGSRVKFVLTDSDGRYRFANVSPSQYRLIVNRAAYDSASVDVPEGIGDTSRLTVALLRKSGIPLQKPLSKGIYRINQQLLEQDYNGDGIYLPMTVKGVAYSPTPIGGYNVSASAIDRSMLYLDTLHANTIRTYSGADPYLLTVAGDHGVTVIVSFWVDGSRSLADPLVRENLLRDFSTMVNSLKGYPSVLCWNLGNEQNYNFLPGEAVYWYDLMQEFAITAYELEGQYYHPVCASNGDIANIGDPAVRASDAYLTYMDLWASNIYKMNLGPSFATYRTRTRKPILVTEFGIDALDNRTKTEYEEVQALVDSMNWVQIRAASDICVGATVFEFTDEWWKAGDPLNHDYGGYATTEHPDGYSNEEWWGLIAVTPGTGGVDVWRPRNVFRMFQRTWI
jgi:hypothetical protein